MKRIIAIFKEKWPNYLLESFVITAGILMAFGLNNWNEQRKRKVLEIEHLASMKQSFTSLKNQLVNDTVGISEVIEANQSILTAIIDDDPYADSLTAHFGNIYTCWPIEPDYSAFESLKSAGIEIITNDSLKNSFTEIFGRAFPLRERQHNEHCDMLMSKLETHSHLWQYDLEGPPVNFEKLKKDNSFTWFLRSNLIYLERQLEYNKRVIPALELDEKQIEAEIARLEGQ